MLACCCHGDDGADLGLLKMSWDGWRIGMSLVVSGLVSVVVMTAAWRLSVDDCRKFERLGDKQP